MSTCPFLARVVFVACGLRCWPPRLGSGPSWSLFVVAVGCLVDVFIYLSILPINKPPYQQVYAPEFVSRPLSTCVRFPCTSAMQHRAKGSAIHYRAPALGFELFCIPLRSHRQALRFCTYFLPTERRLHSVTAACVSTRPPAAVVHVFLRRD